MVALDGSEDVVSHVLDSHRDGGEENLLLLIDVLDGTLLHSLCLSLTDSDSALDADVEVGHHSVADLANVSAVSIGSLLPVGDDTSHVVHVVDEVLLVSADGVGQGDDTGLEELLRVLELSSDSSLSGIQLTSEGLVGSSLSFLVSGQLVVETLGSMSQVLLEAEEVVVLLLLKVGQLLASLFVHLIHLLLRDALVLVKDGLELATCALGSGEVGVGLLLESVHLSLDVLVDLVLSSLVGHDHLGNDLDLVDHLVLDLVELVLGLEHLSHHIALSLGSLLSSSSASSSDVLHSLGESLVLDSSLLSDLVVEGGDGRCKVLTNLVRIGSHLLVHLDEGLIGSLSASLDAILDSLDHLVVASQGCSISILELGVSSLTGIVEGGLNESNVVLHLLSDSLGVGHHGVVVGSELVVEATLALMAWALGVGGCLSLHL